MKRGRKGIGRAVSLLMGVLLVGLLAASGIGAMSVSAATAIIFPVNNGCKVAYYYGKTASYMSGKVHHAGIDIHADKDSNIYAAVSGKVDGTANSCSHVDYYAKNGKKDCGHYNTYGNYIRVKGNDGRYYYYGHLKQNSLVVKKGDKVTAGQKLAVMGSSGASTGKHLHFEVRSSTKSGTDLNVNPASGNYKYKGTLFTYKSGPYGTSSSNNNNNNNNSNTSSNNTSTTKYVVLGSKAKELYHESKVENGKTYYIKAGVGNLYVSSTENKNFGNVNLSTSKNAASRWKAVLANGSWVFENEATKKVLDVYGDTIKSGSNVQIYTRNNNATQLFTVEGTSVKDHYYIKVKGTNICVDCYGTSGWKAGTNVWAYQKTGQADKSQIFQFIAA